MQESLHARGCDVEAERRELLGTTYEINGKVETSSVLPPFYSVCQSSTGGDSLPINDYKIQLRYQSRKQHIGKLGIVPKCKFKSSVSGAGQ